jgi:sugar phosphate isomerase/epimerase
MTYRFSIAPLTTLALDPPAMILLAAATGYAGVGLRLAPVAAGGIAWPLMHDPALKRQTLARMRETGVEVVDVELVRLTRGFDLAAWPAFLEAGAEVGAKRVIAQGYDPDRSRTIDNYGRLCDLAAPFGLGVDLEFPTWIEVPDFASAVAVVAAADRPNAGVLVDALHFFRGGATPGDLEGLPPAWFRLMQLCDAPAEPPVAPKEVIRFAREARLMPGEGELDLIGLSRALPKDLWVSVEVPDVAFAAAHGHEALARRAIEAARRLLA